MYMIIFVSDMPIITLVNSKQKSKRGLKIKALKQKRNLFNCSMIRKPDDKGYFPRIVHGWCP